jgi:hypothetical protein
MFLAIDSLLLRLLYGDLSSLADCEKLNSRTNRSADCLDTSWVFFVAARGATNSRITCAFGRSSFLLKN